MAEILKAFLSSTPGIVLLFIIALTVLGIVIFLIKRLFSSSGEIGKLGLKWGSPASKNGNSIDFSQKLTLLERAFGDEYDKYILDKEDIRTQVEKELKNTQKTALTRAIEYLCLEYSKLHEDDEDFEDASLVRMGQILELYLRRDFGAIMLNRLDMIKENPLLYEKSDLELNCEVQKITDDCILSMKHKIKEYILISDTKILTKLFDIATVRIKDNIDETIKQFVKLNKDQQSRLIELNKKKNENINKRIDEIINRNSTKEA